MNSAIEYLARLGYRALGTVYIIIGFFAAAAGLGIGVVKTADRGDAIRFILHQPFGRMILLILSLGLAGYAIWRLICGLRDAENWGSDAKGLAIRFGSVVRGLVYGGIAIEVFRLALRQTGGRPGGDAQTRHWIARAMDKPHGYWLVAIAGLSVLGYGVFQIYCAWKAKLERNVHIPHGVLTAISRLGLAARGVVFLIIGSSLLFAAAQHDPGEARGTSGALRELASQPFGSHLLTLVGVGLVAYGVYAFLNARYRYIHA